jgi:uncharacterized protein (TIGR02118 family)
MAQQRVALNGVLFHIMGHATRLNACRLLAGLPLQGLYDYTAQAAARGRATVRTLGDRSMHKVMALYKAPPNPEHFRKHYEQVHIPLLRKMPGVVRLNYSFDVKDPAGGSPYFCVFEGYFASAKDMVESLTTPEGQAVVADLANYAAGEYQLINFPVPDDE